MSNIDIYKEYIQDSTINHLERLMGNDVMDDVNLWEKYGSKGLTPQKDSVYRSMLHAMMVPYYKMFGIVNRKKGEQDKRQQIVSLTEKGREMEEQAYKSIPKGMGEQLTSCPLQIEDYQNLADQLDSLIETLKK